MLQGNAQPSGDGPKDWSRGTILTLALVIVLGVVLGWAARGAALNINGDDAIYLTLSRSLSEGHYRDEYLVGTPPHAQYPPGMPAWLLLVQVVVGNSLDAILAGNFLLVALTACLLADAVRRLSTPGLGVVAAAIVMLNPPLLALAGELRSEPLYLSFCAVALWCSLVDGQRARQWFPTFAIAAALAAFLTRSAGVALLPAAGVALLLLRRWRPLIVGGAISIVATGGWFAYTRWAGQHTIGHTYATDLATAAPVAEPVRFLSHVLGNAKEYFARLATTQFSIPDIHNFPLDNAFWALFLAIPAVVGAWTLARRWPALVAFLLLSGGILLVFPWPISRLLAALLPWFVAIILIGWTTIMATGRFRHGVRVAFAVGSVLAAFGVVAQVPVSLRAQRCRTSVPYTDLHCYTVADRSYVAAANFIRDSLPKNAVIAASKPSGIYFLTRRLTLPLELFERSNSASLMAPNGPATAILLSRKFPYEAKSLAPHLRERCSSLTLLARFPAGTLLLGPRTAAAADACLALDEYVSNTPLDFGDDSE